MTIPKILHFTWKTKDLPRPMQRIFEKWQRLHPDWDLRIHDDDDIRALVAEHYPSSLETFDAYPKQIHRADAFRFFVLHKYGGVYSDLDVDPERSIDELIDRTDCFVGAEPEGHIRDEYAYYRGLPFVLCNAFMGSVPNHPFWIECIKRLDDVDSERVVDATGPRFVNGVALQLPRPERPDVLAPDYWSPVDGFWRRISPSDRHLEALNRNFTVLGLDRPTLVSHLWSHTWINPFEKFKLPRVWRVPNWLRWQLRKRLHPELAAVRVPAPAIDYDNQTVEPPHPLPSLYLAIVTDAQTDAIALGGAIAGLDYPADRIAVGVSGPAANAVADRLAGRFGAADRVTPEIAGASARNALAERAAQTAGWCLFIGPAVQNVPADAIRQLLGARRPLVTALIRDSLGSEDAASVLYRDDLFKRLYRYGGRTGVVHLVKSKECILLGEMGYLNIAPLSTVASGFLLVDCNVLQAGARFAETPYKFHIDGQGFALNARDLGFEVCGMPKLVVTVSPDLSSDPAQAAS